MSISTNLAAAIIVRNRMSLATGALATAMSSIVQHREREFAARFAQRQLDFPSEDTIDSVAAVEADMASTFDVPINDALAAATTAFDAVSVDAETASGSLQSILDDMNAAIDALP